MARRAYKKIPFQKILFLLLLISLTGLTSCPAYKFFSCVETSMSFTVKLMVKVGIMQEPRVCQSMESFLWEVTRNVLVHLVYLVLILRQARENAIVRAAERLEEEKEKERQLGVLQEVNRNYEIEALRTALQNAFRIVNDRTASTDGAESLISCVEPEELAKDEESVTPEL